MIAYFDTSAFVKLLVREPGSDDAAAVWAAADVVVASTLLYPEARAALASARRGSRLSEHQANAAVLALHELVDQMGLVSPSRDVVWRAGALAEVHALRGYDSVHLASALAVGPSTHVVTTDRDLATAARAEGLLVQSPGDSGHSR